MILFLLWECLQIWKHVTQMTDALEYVTIAKVYVEYVTKFFGDREINVVLGDVIRHVSKDKDRSNLQVHSISELMCNVAEQNI